MREGEEENILQNRHLAEASSSNPPKTKCLFGHEFHRPLFPIFLSNRHLVFAAAAAEEEEEEEKKQDSSSKRNFCASTKGRKILKK